MDVGSEKKSTTEKAATALIIFSQRKPNIFYADLFFRLIAHFIFIWILPSPQWLHFCPAAMAVSIPPNINERISVNSVDEPRVKEQLIPFFRWSWAVPCSIRWFFSSFNYEPNRNRLDSKSWGFANRVKISIWKSFFLVKGSVEKCSKLTKLYALSLCSLLFQYFQL